MKVPVYRFRLSHAFGPLMDRHLWSAATGPGRVNCLLAARNVETSDGHVLLLWVYLDHDKVEYEFDKGDDESDEDNFE